MAYCANFRIMKRAHLFDKQRYFGGNVRENQKDGAAERTRTSTGMRPLAPEASASTNFATAARLTEGPPDTPPEATDQGWSANAKLYLCPIRCKFPMVRQRGLEPPRGFPHNALNVARLPIPPLPRLMGTAVMYPKAVSEATAATTTL